jgi:hypothetical protein
MLPEAELRNWVQEAIAKSMSQAFKYGTDDNLEENLNPVIVWNKMEKYIKMMREEKEGAVDEGKQEEIREKIEELDDIAA